MHFLSGNFSANILKFPLFHVLYINRITDQSFVTGSERCQREKLFAEVAETFESTKIQFDNRFAVHRNYVSIVNWIHCTICMCGMQRETASHFCLVKSLFKARWWLNRFNLARGSLVSADSGHESTNYVNWSIESISYFSHSPKKTIESIWNSAEELRNEKIVSQARVHQNRLSFSLSFFS